KYVPRVLTSDAPEIVAGVCHVTLGFGVMSRTCTRFNIIPGDIVTLCVRLLSDTNVPIIYCPGAPLPIATGPEVFAPPVKVEVPDWPPRPSFNQNWTK